MKKLFYLLPFLILASCKKEVKKEPLYPDAETSTTPLQLGQEIFDGKGKCYSCHQPEQKVVGPSIQEIAAIYKDKKGLIVSFLKEESEPIVDPSMYDTMKTNFEITKTFSDEELEALESYILSHAK